MSLAFRHKTHLPDRISLHVCSDCDLAFTWPRETDGYARYYGQVANDFHTGVETFRNVEQLDRLSHVIAVRGLKRVLDFGCGGGGLTSELAARHPDVAFVGHDVNGNFPSGSGNLLFTQALPEGPFDLVILSHVLEHTPDPAGTVRHIQSMLKPDYQYIEVPDPRGYVSRDQPQHLYYVDRLHINHFGLKSLTRVAGDDYGLIEYGEYDMPYEVGPIYPSQFALFAVAPRSVAASLKDYLAEQNRTALGVRTRIEHRRFYVYGFGDNFFRNRAPGGPLAGLEANILGVIDRGIEALRAEIPEGWAAVHPDDMASLNGQLIVCTVTQASGLSDDFAAVCPDSEVIYL